MNIIFLTSATSEQTFNEICKDSKVLPNPSNQNFYHKVIKAVSLHENVDVVSLPPYAKGVALNDIRQDDDECVHYRYVPVHNNLFFKLLFEKNAVIKLGSEVIDSYRRKEVVLVVDPLRRNLLRAALKLRAKYHIPVVGVLTDNPYNLTNFSEKQAKRIIKRTSKLDGFLSLTKQLLVNYNVDEKPNYIFEGIVEDIRTYRKEPLGEYCAFAGSLYERYGVKNLVDAFDKVNAKINLVILGNGPLKNYIINKSQSDPRILYLSQMSKEKTYAIEQHAIANFNPRPLNPVIDEQSIPSKMLEYLASGQPTISTKHPRLYDLFKNDVFWIEGNTVDDIVAAIKNFLETPESTRKKKALTAKTKVYTMFGSLPQGEGIAHFLTSFKYFNN